MKRYMTLFLGVLVLLNCNRALAQQPSPTRNESHKYRAILTLAGGGGGFALGLFAGLAAFDDSINSDRKVWTTAALSAAGGAVGGYFLGRTLDKRQNKTHITQDVDDFYRELTRPQWSPNAANSIANSGKEKTLGRLPALSPAAIASGPAKSTDPSGSYCDLNRAYLLSALQKMEPSESQTRYQVSQLR